MSVETGKSKYLKPRILKGFRDLLPKQMAIRARIVNALSEVFESFGYLHLDTPALEYEETLFGELGVDANKQIYRFRDLEANDVGLRYDLTVSLARVVAQYQNELVFPFRRMQTGKVWRYDKPKKGRLREFVQFDADIVGIDSVAADSEIIELLYESFKKIGIEDFVIRINNRRLLTYLLEFLDIKEDANQVFRVLDKLERSGKKAVKRELMGLEKKQAFESAFEEEAALALSGKQADGLLDFIGIEGDFKAVEDMLCSYFGVSSDCADKPGLYEVFETLRLLRAHDLDEKHLKWDLALARGLDYYTGTVVEVILPDKSEFGSVAGGGRYDNLVSRFSSMKFPGVGVAIGVDRLAMALEEDPSFLNGARNAVFIPFFEAALASEYARLAREIRSSGIVAEVYPGTGASLGKQLKYADKAGYPIALIIGGNELALGVVNLKRLWTGFDAANKEVNVKRTGVVTAVKEELLKYQEVFLKYSAGI